MPVTTQRTFLKLVQASTIQMRLSAFFNALIVYLNVRFVLLVVEAPLATAAIWIGPWTTLAALIP